MKYQQTKDQVMMIIIALFILFFSPSTSYAVGVPIAKNQTISSMKNSEKIIILTGSGPTNNHLRMAVISGPIHGRLSNLTAINTRSSQITYIPNKDYYGTDNFRFIAVADNSISKDAHVMINVNPVTVSGWLALLAFASSFTIIFIITLVVSHFIGTRKSSSPKDKYVAKFWDIVRDDDWYPSLARFQFLVWTFIVAFALIGVYFIRIFNGVIEPPIIAPGNQFIIPDNLIILMGISVTVPIASSQISKLKYKINAPRDPPSNDSMPGFETMLEENNKPTLTRYQMFAWTWIGAIIYLMILFSYTTGMLGNIRQLGVPDISPVFVFLMGISNVGYLGGKIVSTSNPIIFRVIPKKDKLSEHITIIGTNFVTSKGNIWFEESHISDPKQVKVSSDDVIWNDNTIDLKVPTSLASTADKEYNIIMQKDEFVTEANDVSKFIVTGTPSSG
jgi:hypothetical protein